MDPENDLSFSLEEIEQLLADTQREFSELGERNEVLEKELQAKTEERETYKLKFEDMKG